MDETMVRRLGAELVGTFILVLGGCGSAVLAAKLFAPVVATSPTTPTVFATGMAKLAWPGLVLAGPTPNIFV